MIILWRCKLKKVDLNWTVYKGLEQNKNDFTDLQRQMTKRNKGYTANNYFFSMVRFKKKKVFGGCKSQIIVLGDKNG